MNADRPWPPLVVAERLPRVVRWRDAVLTLLMWVFFALLLDIEFELLLGDYSARLGLGGDDADPNWPEYFARLLPFLLLAASLVAVLLVFSVRTLRRRRRSLLLPEPSPLKAADEARRAAIPETTLAAAREQRVVTVHIDAGGAYRIETR
jgi:poly-beta-1,6-N-acetyl-D-glucosamine biosynthesis protein PgaD